MAELFSKIFRRGPVFKNITGMRLSDEEYNRIKTEQTDLAMKLLEKVARKGEKKLTRRERQFLNDFSKSSFANGL